MKIVIISLFVLEFILCYIIIKKKDKIIRNLQNSIDLSEKQLTIYKKHTEQLKEIDDELKKVYKQLIDKRSE